MNNSTTLFISTIFICVFTSGTEFYIICNIRVIFCICCHRGCIDKEMKSYIGSVVQIFYIFFKALVICFTVICLNFIFLYAIYRK